MRGKLALAAASVTLITISGSCANNAQNIDHKHPLPVHCRRQVGATCIGATPGGGEAFAGKASPIPAAVIVDVPRRESPLVDAPGHPNSSSCAISAHGRGGVNSFRLVVTADPCALKIKAKTLCWTVAGPRYWQDGNVVQRKAVSKAQCTLSFRTAPFGYLYKPNLTFPWEWTFLGPIPPHEQGRQPSRRCNPRAYAEFQAGLEYSAIFRRLPCSYDFQAAVQCSFTGGSSWHFGPTAAFNHGLAASGVHCPSYPPGVLFIPFGYRWRPSISSGWRFHALGPVPPVEKR